MRLTRKVTSIKVRSIKKSFDNKSWISVFRIPVLKCSFLKILYFNNFKKSEYQQLRHVSYMWLIRQGWAFFCLAGHIRKQIGLHGPVLWDLKLRVKSINYHSKQLFNTDSSCGWNILANHFLAFSKFEKKRF